MFNWIINKIVGTHNQRVIKKMKPMVDLINARELELQSLSEAELKNQTKVLQDRLKAGETRDDILVDAYAVVKNACRRLCGQSFEVCGQDLSWNMIPYDVQLLGAVGLHNGNIMEMATGEGKTLVATLPLYLNALSGKGAHIVTVNDYLAKRDSQWMGRIFEYLGLTVGCLQNQMHPGERKEAYNCDITYGTNSEFGFDYLRDNSMASSKAEQVQRGHNYAIIDEVDSILIDEARTPLIISGPVPVSTHKYDKLKPIVANLFKSQSLLCSRILKEAKDLIAKEEFDSEILSKKLILVQKGAPKSKQFLKLLEDPKIKKMVDKAETLYTSDSMKEEYQVLKEDLFFLIEEKNNVIELTEKGRSSISVDENEFMIPDIISQYQEVDEDTSLTADEKEAKKLIVQKNFEETSEKIHDLNQLLKAYSLFEKDVDYVVQENKVMIVDEFTGRIMQGRRFSDGLHQALEAKENVKIEDETQTFATITIQNYFRMYDKLSGMTGTAETEANEFFQIYKLDVLVALTNRPIVRADLNDLIFKTKREKFNAIADKIAELNQKGQPVLVGTITVDTSEILSRYLKRRGIEHSVLNAKYHQQEAEIVARAGSKGSVTIATNMAGRGTDIKINDEVVALGGLYVIGTERHESRRIDRQLRGRSGRQGDPGTSQFYVSLEDDLMRLFGSERIAGIMEKMGLEEGQELTHPLLTRSIERAQKRVEDRNFSIRKHTLEYDDVMNKQREIIYSFRKQFIENDNLRSFILDTIAEVVEKEIDFIMGDATVLAKDKQKVIFSSIHETFPLIKTEIQPEGVDLKKYLLKQINDFYDFKEKYEGAEGVRMLERYISLQAIDKLWKEHLYNMDQLRESVYLRAYGQVNPLLVYKKEGFTMFAEMMDSVKTEIASGIFKHAIISDKDSFANVDQNFQHDIISGFNIDNEQQQKKQSMSTNRGENTKKKGITLMRESEKIGRNDVCPCGSGKKYKKCCGA